MSGPIGWSGVVEVYRRPALWPTVVRLARATLPRRWWRRWPPGPSAGYLSFRGQTMWGGDGRGKLTPEELIAYLEWCREMTRRDVVGCSTRYRRAVEPRHRRAVGPRRPTRRR